ncbi:MAG: hypothetical protein FWF70_03825 [Bacteroidetes bacterium]|nr:hypothetical protein [Bacteroidota bacterium]MCL1968163.1 hypothetical protein [Bacteroidota bacterium]
MPEIRFDFVQPKECEHTLRSLIQFLDSQPMNIVLAIDKEGSVTELQSQRFLQKHNIGAASSAKKALDTLLDKEMVFAIESTEKTAYRVYNVFLMRWLNRTF